MLLATRFSQDSDNRSRHLGAQGAAGEPAPGLGLALTTAGLALVAAARRRKLS